MGGFAEAMLERVRAARESVRDATAAKDAYRIAVAQDELDDALRVARRHGLDPDTDTGTDASSRAQ